MRDPTPAGPGPAAPGATPPADDIPDLYRQLLDEAVATLTRAAHLTWNRPGTDGQPVAERCDWAEFVTLAVAGAAANIGSSEEALAGRSGSWEAACVRDLLSANVGPDDNDLYRHRTEPVVIDLDVDDVLTEQGAWLPYFAAKDELVHRLDAARADVIGRHGDYPAEQAELDRLEDEFDELHAQVEQLRQEHWASYGHALEANIRAAAATLPGLAVPVLVNVNLDRVRPAARHSGHCTWTLADELLTHAIAATPLPADSQPPLDRLSAAGGRLAATVAEPVRAAQPTSAAAPRWSGPTEPDGPSALGLAR